jgi:lipopolysaccharide biosynthesis glycosyltransferase
VHVQHPDHITLVAAADRSYAVQLDVMLTSVRRHLPDRWRLSVVVMTTDLTSRDVGWRARRPGDTLDCVTPPIDSVASLPLRPGDHVSLATYYRLFLADVIPADARRVVYLDSDLVVLHDVSELAHADLEGRTVGAVQSFSTPYLRVAGPAFAAVDCREDTPYFNAGVLVIDAERWRSGRVKERALEFLAQRFEQIRFWDQDALNFALMGDWEQLDLRWNRTSDYHGYAGTGHSDAFPVAAWRSLATPYVAHFVSGYKPWTYFRHPDKAIYDRYLRIAGHDSERMTLWKAIRRRVAGRAAGK